MYQNFLHPTSLHVLIHWSTTSNSLAHATPLQEPQNVSALTDTKDSWPSSQRNLLSQNLCSGQWILKLNYKIQKKSHTKCTISCILLNAFTLKHFPNTIFFPFFSLSQHSTCDSSHCLCFIKDNRTWAFDQFHS